MATLPHLASTPVEAAVEEEGTTGATVLLSLFDRLTALGAASPMCFSPGDEICVAGQDLRLLHLVGQGVVELSGTENGEQCTVLLLSSGDLVYPVAGLFGEPCLTSAVALTPTRTRAVPMDIIRASARSDPEIAMALSAVIGGQWRMAVRHILDLKCRSAPQRLASFLLRLASESASPHRAELPFSKGALAARIGISRETLSRAIQIVAEQGLLLRGREIAVRDRARIERFCAPDPYPGFHELALQVHAY